MSVALSGSDWDTIPTTGTVAIAEEEPQEERRRQEWPDATGMRITPRTRRRTATTTTRTTAFVEFVAVFSSHRSLKRAQVH